jgi:hypothetical protein
VADCLPAFRAADKQYTYNELTYLIEAVDARHRGQPKALVHPGLLIERFHGVTSVLGPLGMARVSPRDDQTVAVWHAIAAAGALVTGHPNDLVEVSRLLQQDQGSRTLSYLLALTRDAGPALSAMRRLRGTPVTVLGCGGIGSLAAALLAGAGLQTLTLVDGDRIEASNLNRQLFFTVADVGKLKVLVLREALVARYPNLLVKAADVSCCDEESIRRVLGVGQGPVIVSADDPVGIGSLVTRVMQHSDRTVYTAGYRFTEGSVSRATTQETRESLGSWHSLPRAVTPSFGPQNAQIASMLATRVLLDIGGLRDTANNDVVWDTAMGALRAGISHAIRGR